MGRLTVEQLDQALALKVDGKTYADIAEIFGVTNDHNLRQQIKDYMAQGITSFALDLQTVVALDMARAERLLAPMMADAVETRSTRHVDASVKLMRLKLEQMRFLQELQTASNADEDEGTFKTDDELYEEAFDMANRAILEGEYEISDDEVEMDLNDEELKLLETQLVDLDANIQVVAGGADDGRTADF